MVKPDMLDINDLPFMAWMLDGTTLKVKRANNCANGFIANPFLTLSESDKEILYNFLLGKTDGESVCLECKKNDGTSSWINFQIRPATTEGDRLLFGMDVSPIKESEYQLKQILDSIPDLILVKGEHSHIKWANTSFQKYYGMNNEELQKIIIDASFNKPDYTKQYVIDDAWVWNNQKPLMIECEPVTCHDGTVRKFQTFKAPIFNKDGQIQATVGICRDITENIENKERAYASSKMASLGEMAGGISHEINNPLAVILGRTRQIQRKLTTENRPVEDDLFDYLRNIEDHSYRISKIVEGLKRFCQEGMHEPFVVKNIGDILQQIQVFCHSRLASLGITAEINIPANLEAEVKSVSLSQVMLNLLNNAIDAVEGSKSPWIKIEAKTNNNYLEIRFTDSGPGVSEDIATKVMQPFFTTKDNNRGAGLGLSISQTIVNHHGGTLKLDRSVSKSCFLLSFPIRQKA